MEEIPDHQNNYKILVDSDNLLNPKKETLTEKIVICDKKLHSGQKLFCNAILNKSSREVIITKFYILTNVSNEIELEKELVDMANSLEYTPKDIMSIIYQSEIDEEDELQDTTDEEGNN